MSLFLNIAVSVYMVLLLAVMPFYFTKGYGRIGTDKYEFFREVTIYAGVIILPLVLIYCCIKWAEGRKTYGRCQKENMIFFVGDLSVTDVFAILYEVATLLSWLHSDYRTIGEHGNAWTGAKGWYMGLSTQLMFLGIYFIVSRFWKPNKWLPALWLPVTFVVYFLGYCNRFGVYPIKMEYATRAFISTVGNINWYCGYMVIVIFGALYYWWRNTVEQGWVKVLLTIYCVMGFGALITQGSSSGFLTLAVLCPVCLASSVKSDIKMQRFWLMAVCLGVAASLTYGLRSVFPGRFVYPDPLVELVTNTPAPVILLLFSLGIYSGVLYCYKCKRYPMVFFVRFGKFLTGLMIGLAGLSVCLIAVNTRFPGSLGKFSEIPIFTFDENWGSSRGAIWLAAIKCWLDQPLSGKVLGVGPDCMANYIYEGNSPEVLAMVQHQFQGSILTNAHCEWLNLLVNCGLFGAVAFGGMMISAIKRYVKCGRKSVLAGACGIGLLAYTINNMVSFQQAMATTTMFLVLGMGEAFVRQQEKGMSD